MRRLFLIALLMLSHSCATIGKDKTYIGVGSAAALTGGVLLETTHKERYGIPLLFVGGVMTVFGVGLMFLNEEHDDDRKGEDEELIRVFFETHL